MWVILWSQAFRRYLFIRWFIFFPSSPRETDGYHNDALKIEHLGWFSSCLDTRLVKFFSLSFDIYRTRWNQTNIEKKVNEKVLTSRICPFFQFLILKFTWFHSAFFFLVDVSMKFVTKAKNRNSFHLRLRLAQNDWRSIISDWSAVVSIFLIPLFDGSSWSTEIVVPCSRHSWHYHKSVPYACRSTETSVCSVFSPLFLLLLVLFPLFLCSYSYWLLFFSSDTRFTPFLSLVRALSPTSASLSLWQCWDHTRWIVLNHLPLVRRRKNTAFLAIISCPAHNSRWLFLFLPWYWICSSFSFSH